MRSCRKGVQGNQKGNESYDGDEGNGCEVAAKKATKAMTAMKAMGAKLPKYRLEAEESRRVLV